MTFETLLKPYKDRLVRRTSIGISIALVLCGSYALYGDLWEFSSVPGLMIVMLGLYLDSCLRQTVESIDKDPAAIARIEAFLENALSSDVANLLGISETQATEWEKQALIWEVEYKLASDLCAWWGRTKRIVLLPAFTVAVSPIAVDYYASDEFKAASVCWLNGQGWEQC